MNLKNIILTQDSKSGKVFDLFFQLLILLSLVMFSLETLPSLSYCKAFFHNVEVVIVTLFTIEYLLRLWAHEHRVRFVFSFYGIVDLLAILPFYITYGLVDLRSVRIFRFFRLIRMFKLMKYTKAINHFKSAFISIKNELVVFAVATTFILYLSSVGIYYFEREAQPDTFQSVFHSMWWSVATLTTVGYGDVYPVTIGGKIFTFFILMLGLGIVSIPTALLASALSTSIKQENN